jgi:hypothetical protein
MIMRNHDGDGVVQVSEAEHVAWMKQTLVDRTSEQAGGGNHLLIAIQGGCPKLFDLPG